MVRIIDKINLRAARGLANKWLEQARQAVKHQPQLVRPALANGPAADFNLMMSSSGNDPKAPVNQVFDQFFGSQTPADIAPGMIVQGEKGYYHVVEKFAEGGMAEIFLVKDQQRRQLLLKRMLDFSEYGTKIAQAAKLRFANEVGIMSNIDPLHPGKRHVVQLVDRDPQPLPEFYIMEKINGKNLFDAVPVNRTLNPRLGLVIVMQILHGLMAFEYAAKSNASLFRIEDDLIAHRDLKPENILLEIEGKKVKRAVLSDFGIVKLPGSELTEMHEFIGTPVWSAPETLQVGGSKSAANQRSDIYALGAILYWLFTGLEPIKQEEMIAFAHEPQQFISRMEQNRPPEVSPSMWLVTFKAMAARPEDRFQSFEAMQQALNSVYKER